MSPKKKIFPVCVNNEYELVSMFEKQEKAILLSKEYSLSFDSQGFDLQNTVESNSNKKAFMRARKHGDIAGKLAGYGLGFLAHGLYLPFSISVYFDILIKNKILQKKIASTIKEYIIVKFGDNASQFILIKMEGKNRFSLSSEELCFDEAISTGFTDSNKFSFSLSQ